MIIDKNDLLKPINSLPTSGFLGCLGTFLLYTSVFFTVTGTNVCLAIPVYLQGGYFVADLKVI